MTFYCAHRQCHCRHRFQREQYEESEDEDTRTDASISSVVKKQQLVAIYKSSICCMTNINNNHNNHNYNHDNEENEDKCKRPVTAIERQLSNGPLLSPSTDHSFDHCLHRFQQEDVVYDEEGQMIGGSVQALIKRLIPRSDYCPDRAFVFTLLINIRSFIAPCDLIQHILQQCMFDLHSTTANFKKEARARLFSNVLILCTEWSRNIPYDFRNISMQERLTELLAMCSVNADTEHKADHLIHQLTASLNKLDRYEKALNNLKMEVGVEPQQSEHLSGLLTLCDNPTIVAHQLTHIELERLSMIGLEEFVTTLTAESEIADSNGRDNIKHYVNWFNRMSQLVATEICRQLKRRHRVSKIEFFIAVAKECIELANFNSLMAIVAGLSLPPVARLRKTWSKVETSKLEILQHQLDPSANFTSYRSTLKAALWRAEGAKNDHEKIIVPFFSLLLKDLVLVHQRCARLLPNGHVNFAMFRQFAEQMSRLMHWKSASCPFERSATLLQHLLTTKTFSEKHLLLASFECEMPEHITEKDQHRKLKHDLQFVISK